MLNSTAEHSTLYSHCRFDWGQKMPGNSNGRQTEGLFLIYTLLPNHTSTNTKSTTSTDRPIQDGQVRRTWRIHPHVRPVCELQTHFSGRCENAAADPCTLLCIPCIWLKSCFLKMWFLIRDFWIFTSSWAVLSKQIWLLHSFFIASGYWEGEWLSLTVLSVTLIMLHGSVVEMFRYDYSMIINS